MVDEQQKHIPSDVPHGGTGNGERPDARPDEDSAVPQVLVYVRTFLITILIALFLKTFVIEAFRIPSGSMENTLLVGDFLLVNKLAYGVKTPRYVPLTNLAIPSVTIPAFGKVRRGDVVVFEFPGRHLEADGPEPVYYIKRCIGLPGDTITISHGRVHVNGREVLPPLLGKSPYTESVSSGVDSDIGCEGDNHSIIVPKRGDVIDLDPFAIARWKELIEREHHRVDVDRDGSVLVDGAPSRRYTVEQDHYFMLGDNRGNSLDSRYWGFVPEANIVGEALLVYWSWDPEDAREGLRDRVGSIRWSRVFTLIH